MSTLSRIKRLFARFGKRIVAPIIVVLVPLLILVLGITSSVGVPWRSDDFLSGDGTSADGKPAEKSEEQVDLDNTKRARDSQSGLLLQQDGYTGVLSVVKYRPLVDFLNKSLEATGTYVQFTSNPTKELPDRYDDPDADGAQAKPDVIVDAESGIMVALSKNYSNGRGLTCFSQEDPRTMTVKQFNKISADVWNKSLDQVYTHANVASIPSGITCFAQSS